MSSFSIIEDDKTSERKPQQIEMLSFSQVERKCLVEVVDFQRSFLHTQHKRKKVKIIDQ